MASNYVEAYAYMYGGEFLGAIDQYDYIRSHGLKGFAGVCYGFSLIYLRMSLDGKCARNFVREKTIWTYADKLQSSMVHVPDTALAFPSVAKWIQIPAMMAGFRLVGINRIGKSLPDYINTTQGSYIIAFGTHACAVHRRPNGNLVYVDCCYGHAEFSSRQKFSDFLREVQRNRFTLREYRVHELSGYVLRFE